MMKIVDTKGLRCPEPLIKTRKALNEASEGESLQVLIDNPASLNNIKRFLSDNRISFTESGEGGKWIITIERGESTMIADNAETYCQTVVSSAVKRTVIAVSSDTMGSGDDELGKKLINSFFKVLPLLSPVPAVIVFYNSGVKLAIHGSSVEEYLKEMEGLGTELVYCTTCTDFFNLSSNMAVGRAGDMYQILNIMNEADSVIKP